MLQPQAQHFTIQMLYGSAAQQARQLAPGSRQKLPMQALQLMQTAPSAWTRAAKQSLFQHLLQRSQTTQQT